MLSLLSETVASVGTGPLILLLVCAFITSMIHGATGIAGGFLLAAVAAPIIGLQLVVPILSITLLISHSARALLNAKKIDKHAYWRVMLPAAPCIALTAFAYGRMSGAGIAFLLGSVVLISIPLRRWAKKLEIKTSKRMLMGSGAIYGGISGMSIGPGMLLMPVLLGFGMNRETFVATLALIALSTNIVRSSIFGFTSILNPTTFMLGVLIGLATIPGTWVGRGILRRITDAKHIAFAEILVIIGGLNFFWLGFRALSNTQ